MNPPLIRQIPVPLLLCLLLPGCVIGATAPEYTDIDFLALVKGQDASIIHIDDKGHATVAPVDFLKGHILLGWAAAGLDEVVTCEKSAIHEDELEFKYYDHKLLAQTFRMASTSYKGELFGPYMMFLLAEKKYLFVGPASQDMMIRFDLKTGVRTDVKISSGVSNAEFLQGYLNPLWDAEKHSLIVEVGDLVSGDRPQRKWFLARLDPDTFTIKDKIPYVEEPGIYFSSVSQLLYYDRVGNKVVFYGDCGYYAAKVLNGGRSQGFFEMPLDTGQPKLLIRDDIMPSLGLGTTHTVAVINQRYLIATPTRNNTLSGQSSDNTHTYLVDLKTHGVQMLDMPYVTWPISQEGLHVETTPTTPSNH